jgi:hypothetical protein
MAIGRHVVVEARTEKLTDYANNCPLNTMEDNGADIGIISSGITYQYAKEALGDRANYCKLGLVWPLPTTLLSEFCAKCKTVYVIEELDPFIEEHCRTMGLTVIGKEVFSLLGEYTPNRIRGVVLGQEPPVSVTPKQALPARPPVLCPGCPHRGTFYVLQKLGLTVSGDIGCYTLGAVAPLSSLDTCICMGASVSAAHGMSKVTSADFNKKLVSVIGDSTFMHSGITGLVDMVYNQSANTVIILDNSITGMTGHQDNPTTVKAIRGFVTWTRDEHYYVDSGWRGKLATEGGGVLINQSIHTMDLMNWFMGRAASVEASCCNRHLKGIIEVEDTLEALIDYNGVPGIFYATTAYGVNSPVLIELSCENLTVRMEESEVTIRRPGKEVERMTFVRPALPGKDYWGVGHHDCIADFYDCIEQDKPFRNDVPSIENTLDLMLSVYESAAKNGESVAL